MTLPARFRLRILACLILAGQALLAHDPHDPIQTIAVSPNFAQDQTIYAATGLLSLKYGIFVLLKSTDGGIIWSTVQGMTNNLAIYQILFSPAYATDQTVFVIGTGGLFATSNQGSSWIQLSNVPLINAALSPNFATDNTMVVLTNAHTVLVSTNRGQTFTPGGAPPNLSGGLSSVAVSPNYATDSVLLLGTVQNGIYRSSNGGASWTSQTSGQTIPNVQTINFSPNFGNDQTTFATTYGAGVLISTNGGRNWSLSNTGISDMNVTDLSFSPAYALDSTIWITTAAAGVYQSTNGATSWTLQAKISRTLSNLTTTHYQTIAAASSGPNALIYMGAYEGLWSTSNPTQSWLYIDTLPTRIIRHINVSPNYTKDLTLFGNTYGGGNLKSTDGGNSWSIPNTGMTLTYTDASGISPNFATDQTVFSSDAQGLERSTNGGASWSLLQGLGAGQSNYPRAFATAPNFSYGSANTTLFVGLSPATATQATGLFISTNAGNTWSSACSSNVGATGVISIAVSPGYTSDQTVFAASPTNGLYRSTNGGITCTGPLSVGAKPPGLALVAVTPSFVSDSTVFAAGISGGIFKSMDGGQTWAELPGTASLRALDMAVSPNYANDQSLYVGTLQKGLLKFTNGGSSVISLGLPDSLVTAVALSPNIASDHTIFAAAYHGLFKSTTTTPSWNMATTPARMEESRQANSTYAPQNPPSIIYSGSWTGVDTCTQCSSIAYMGTTQAGATATFNFTGDGIRWITSTGKNEGTVAISLDGVPQTTVKLNSSSLTQYQQSVWSLQGLTCGLHSLVITSQTAGATVPIDAFDVWVSTCPLP